ncbi:tyrosine-type recombinase/integrase [Planctomycetota bacterium]
MAIKRDLADAGIEYRDQQGRFRDFHSLRSTTASWLVACGVDPKTAQVIMRHCSINLTMSVYAKALGGSEAKAVAALPDLSEEGHHTHVQAG